MANKKDAHQILELIEDQYQRDLALHLYSTFLLHQIDPVFPRKKWAAWPLPKEEVPDPLNTRLYVDSVVDDNYQDNSYLEEAELGMFQRFTAGEGKFISTDKVLRMPVTAEEQSKSKNSSDSSGSDLGSGSESNSESEQEDQTFDDRSLLLDDEDNNLSRIKNVFSREKLSNPRASLLNEILSMMEHKIYQRYKESKSELVPTPDLDIKALNEMSKQVANRVAKVVDKMLDFDHRKQKGHAKKGRVKLYDWQDMLIANLEAESSRNRLMDCNKHKELYAKCERLFSNEGYRYELINDDNVAGPDLEEDGGNTESRIINTEEFDHVEFLEEVEETNSSIVYQNHKERTLKRQEELQQVQEYKKLLFMKKLRLQQRFNKLTWDGQELACKRNWNDDDDKDMEEIDDLPKKWKLSSKRKTVYVPQSEVLKGERMSAINNGSIQMSAEDFMAKI